MICTEDSWINHSDDNYKNKQTNKYNRTNMTVIYYDITKIPKLLEYTGDYFSLDTKKFTQPKDDTSTVLANNAEPNDSAVFFDPNPNKIRVFLQFVRVVDDTEYDLNSEYDGVVLEFRNYNGFSQHTFNCENNDQAYTSNGRKHAYFYINRHLYTKYFINGVFSNRVQPGQVLDIWCIPQYIKDNRDQRIVFIYSISLVNIIDDNNDLKYLIDLFSKE